jgi:hypothetical protein
MTLSLKKRKNLKNESLGKSEYTQMPSINKPSKTQVAVALAAVMKMSRIGRVDPKQRKRLFRCTWRKKLHSKEDQKLRQRRVLQANVHN